MLDQLNQIFCILASCTWIASTAIPSQKTTAAVFPAIRSNVCLDQGNQTTHCILLTTSQNPSTSRDIRDIIVWIDRPPVDDSDAFPEL